MDVNLPDRGVFKGIGTLQRFVANNKKYFPNHRNIHQFVYTHGHNNDYSTVHKKFDLGRSFSKPEVVQIIKKNTNQSHFTLGFNETDRAKLRKPLQPTYLSLAKTQFQKYDKAIPPSQIKQAEEGLGFGDRLDVIENQLKPKKQKGKKLFNRSQQPNSATNMRRSAIELINQMNKNNNYQTTTMSNFSNPSKIKIDNPHYQFGRSRRFNPITGQQMGKNTTFGYEDFNENTNKKYKANNFSRIQRGVKGGFKQDIISGRMINY